MPSPQPDAAAPEPPLPPVKLDPLAAVMSFLIPGLGQVYQGRVGKGLLFFLGLYLLFFDGMWMGQWRNVWIPDAHDLPEVQILAHQLEGLPKALYYRPQYLGQFWIGVAAWPALYQYIEYTPAKQGAPVFGKFERMPSEEELNDLQRNASKRWDLGWVYTVIAGVLNLLVIYDALAGPMFRDPPTAAAVEAESQPPAAPAKAANQPPAASAPSPAPPAAAPPSPAAQPQPVAQPKGGQT